MGDQTVRGQLVRLGVMVLVLYSLAPQALASQPESPYPIPDGVLASADEYVISKVGRAFFDSCIARSLGLPLYRPLAHPSFTSATPDWLQYPRYVVIYKLRISGRPFVDEVVVVNIKENGGWFEDTAHDEGLPDCVSQPEECEFPIDEAAAIEIARDAGLQPGSKPWKADFSWFGRKHKTYAWVVENELGEWFGESVLIDANDGVVINMGEWIITVSGHGPSTAP